MWKRLPSVLTVGLLVLRCAGNPAAPSRMDRVALPSAVATPDVTDSASDPSNVAGTWLVGGAQGDFRVRPDPAVGAAPLTVHINMCHSTDPKPGISLHYHVDWRDGADDHGFCRFEHVYENAGTFQANACVWDEIPAHWPGVCLEITFTATSLTTTTPAPPAPLCHPIIAGTGFCFGGGCPAAACPTGATQFCDAVPIVPTSSAQAQAACNACSGAGTCFNLTFGPAGGGLWRGSAATGQVDFVYGSINSGVSVFCVNTGSPHAPAAGEILDGGGCPLVPASRWAP